MLELLHYSIKNYTGICIMQFPTTKLNIIILKCNEIGKTWEEIETLAQVRTHWQRFVNSLSPPDGP